MNDFQGLLSGDYGFKPQGKSAPMAPPRSNPSTINPAYDLAGATSSSSKKVPYSKPSDSGVFLHDHDTFFSRTSSRKNTNYANLGGLGDVFGSSSRSPANSPMDVDSIFSGPGDSGSRFSSLPVFDKPVYDDEHDSFDDLLGGLGHKESASKGLDGSRRKNENDVPAFDDLLHGFGESTTPSISKNTSDSSWGNDSTVRGAAKITTDVDVPFVVLKSSSLGGPSTQALYDDPLERFNMHSGSSSKKSENFSPSGELFDDIDLLGGLSSKKAEKISASRGSFDDIDPLGGLGNSVPMNDTEKVRSPARRGTTVSSGHTSASVDARGQSSSIGSPGTKEKMPLEDYHESPSFDTYSASADSHKSAPNTFFSSHVNISDDTTSQTHTSTVYANNLDSSDEVWLTVSEIPLFTQPTAAPPPFRPPPPKPPRISKARHGSNIPRDAKKKIDDHSSFPTSAQLFQSPKSSPSAPSPIDEVEDFAKRRSWNDPDVSSGVLSGDGSERHSDAAASADAMKQAMDKAEARFKHAKEVRERENIKATRIQQEQEDEQIPDFQEREFRERQERERGLREEERKRREEEETTRREMEVKEREQRRIERERIERERVRQAVERATREARERAAVEVRARAERVAIEKAQTQARERSERAAVQKAHAEARERAGRAAVEAKQRADREKSEREAKEKAARDKAAAAAATANQQKNENDLESFFGMGSRPSSAPRPKTSSSDPFYDSQLPKKQSDSATTSVGSIFSTRKASSSTNFADDLGSIFEGAPSAGESQEFDGETKERRKARMQRHQRTQERAAKALAEKNQRDLVAQKEQAERHRIAETLDVEVKRWSAGKEGNLRALLSTLQYVLWPECGWQPVSLTDLITGASVKKVYRKATLCIHPDKVQQKGATLQQKYVAEKVFDLLKEAWTKFNSEELF